MGINVRIQLKKILIGDLWLKETPDKYCPNNKYNGDKSYDQLTCQKLCEAESSCVGIAFTQTRTSLCFLCLDDGLDSFSLNYGFYRQPLGNSKVHCTL